MPDKAGKLADIVLGFDNLDGYVKKSPYFGATVGRVANRIKDAKFELEGKTYKLAANNGRTTCTAARRAGTRWSGRREAKETPDGPSLELTYVSHDGEEGYPGTVTATTSTRSPTTTSSGST